MAAGEVILVLVLMIQLGLTIYTSMLAVKTGKSRAWAVLVFFTSVFGFSLFISSVANAAYDAATE